MIMNFFIKTPDIYACLTEITFQLLALIFVDGTDLFTFAYATELILQTATRLQIMLSHWRGAHLPSGGKLRPEKCYWYAIYCTWTNSSWSYGNRIELDIKLPNDKGKNISINQLPVAKAKEVVGIWVCPDGKCVRQKEKLHSSTSSFTAQLHHKYIDKNLLWMGVRQVLFPTIRYCLPTTSFSESDCVDIMRLVKKLVILKLRLNRNFPHALLYATLDYGSRNFLNLYEEQEISYIDTWLAHCSTMTITGRIFITELENLQIEIGELSSVFNLKYEKFSYRATPCWILSLWKFISDNNIVLSSFAHIHSVPLRINDRSIMIYFETLLNLNRNNKKILNKVRICLQITSPADIVIGNRKYVREPIMNARRQNDCKRSLDWGI